MRNEPERIARVNQVGELMRKRYRELGFNTLSSQSPIIPILIGDTMRTIGVWKALFDGGVFVNPVINPAVPEGQELLRTSYMATHTDKQLETVLSVFEHVGREFGLIA